MWFDSHCHIQAGEFDADREQVLARAIEAGIDYLLLATTDLADSKRVLELARHYPGVYCSAGFHPHEAEGWEEGSYRALKTLILEANQEAADLGRPPYFVAVGEIGLDYYYDHSPREVQRKVFRRQIALAHELGLPIIVHEREAFQDSFQILQEAVAEGLLPSERPGVCHCFSGSVESGQMLLDLGFYLGFDGPITFKNAKQPPKVASTIRLDRLLLETDSPYLTPVPFRGKRNEPARLVLIGEKLAALRDLDLDLVASQTSHNSLELFGLTDYRDWKLKLD